MAIAQSLPDAQQQTVSGAAGAISLEHAPMTPFQIGAVLICMVLNLIDGFDVLAIAFAAPSLAKDWQLAPDALGLLLSSGLVGMTAGSLFVAPLADRWGRRFMTLLTLVIVSVGMFTSAATSNTAQLAAARVFTGIGIGAMLPSINTLVAEYSSAQRRELALSVMSTGYPIGATLGGVAAIFISGALGWRGIFVFGGVLSTVMIPLVLARLPESLDFLLSKQPKNALPLANALLHKLDRPALQALPPVSTRAQSKSAVGELFAPGMAPRTLLLWAAFFMVMFAFYFVMSWTPKLLVEAGLPVDRGLSGGVLLNLGGIVGTLLLGVLSAKVGIFRLHTFALGAAAVSIAAFGVLSGTLQVAMVLALVVGFFLFTSMVGLYVITPSIYPTEVRNTGTGLAIGVGRCGAILSPILAGILLAGGWKPADAYIAFGLPALIAAVAVAWLARVHKT